MKALIIDDKRTISESLKLLIQKSGHFHDIDLALDGIDACQKITSFDYDLIVLDLNLPKLSGREVLHYINSKYENRPNQMPHIMLISGDVDTVKINSAAQLNVESVLTKPFSAKDFNSKLYSILESLNGEIIAA